MTAPKSVIKALALAAEWYAKHGFYVFPCRPGTKKPATPNGLDDATIDLAQVWAWWKKNPNYNIGINCGLSGLLVVDRDLYKTNAEHDAIELSATVTVNTARGGIHDWYRMPIGKTYGNSRGTLPKWLDIRGFGGYVIAPPGVFVEAGKELHYTFADGYRPTEIGLADLPASIAVVLDTAQASRIAVPVNFTTGCVPEPDLTRWWLSDDALDLIHNGAQKGGRSEADQSVITALARAGATDDDIRAVFVHFAIGEKYREKGTSGDKYLAYSIGKARAWLEDHPPDPRCTPAAVERLAAARVWVRGVVCINRLRAVGVRRVADLIPVLDAIVEIAQSRRTSRIVTTVRDIADRCGLSASTGHRRLGRLVDAGLLTTQADPYGTLVDLSPLLDLSGTLSTIHDPNVYPVPVRSTSEGDFFGDHRGDDAFTSYPYSYALKRRQAPTVLMQSLGASGLLLWDALLEGGTVNDLAEVTGLTVSAVRVTLKRYGQAGLVVIWEEGRSKVYELHPDAWDRLEERREHMVTAGIGQLRAARNASEKASFAQRKLQSRMPLEPRDKAKLQMRRDRADDKAAAYYDALLGMGINPYAKVQHRERRPYTLKIDHGEEWVSIYRPIWEAWQELADLKPADRYRAMGFAGWERDEIDKARHMAGRMGKGPRQFIGVNDPQQAVAA